MSVGRLSLGSAQLGMRHGVGGGVELSEGEVTNVLQTAVDLGISALDTSPAYGLAEQRIGAFLSEHDLVSEISVCTKLPALGDLDPARLEHVVEERIMGSLQRLRCECIDRYLIEDPGDLRAHGDRLVDALLRERELGRILDLGLAVNAPEELELLAEHPELDVVQHPFSLLDRRLLQGERLSTLRSSGTKLQLRSVLVRGLLVHEPEDIPPTLSEARSAVAALRGVLRERGLTLPEAAVAYALSLDADRVVVGAESAAQLERLVALSDLDLPEDLTSALDSRIGDPGPAAYDPRTWPQHG